MRKGFVKGGKKPLVLLSLIVVTAVTAGFLYAQRYTQASSLESSTKHYHKQQYTSLSESLSKVPASLNAWENDKDLQRYQELLTDILSSCGNLLSWQNKTDTSSLSVELKDNLSQTKLLCSDLRAVAFHAQAVHRTNRVFTSYGTDNLRSSDLNKAAEELTRLNQMITSPKQLLNKVSYPPVQDPALPELTNQYDTLQSAIIKHQSTQYSSDAEQLASLNLIANKIDTTRKNFVSAYKYYWASTVNLDQLDRKVEQLSLIHEN